MQLTELEEALFERYVLENKLIQVGQTNTYMRIETAIVFVSSIFVVPLLDAIVPIKYVLLMYFFLVGALCAWFQKYRPVKRSDIIRRVTTVDPPKTVADRVPRWGRILVVGALVVTFFYGIW